MEVIAYLLIFASVAVVLSIGVIIGDNVPSRGPRGRKVSTWLSVVFLPVLIVAFVDSPVELPMMYPFYAFTFAFTWRARIWWNDSELERRRSIRAARRRARIYPSRGTSRRVAGS